VGNFLSSQGNLTAQNQRQYGPNHNDVGSNAAIAVSNCVSFTATERIHKVKRSQRSNIAIDLNNALT
jgi:hypothetical protein